MSPGTTERNVSHTADEVRLMVYEILARLYDRELTLELAEELYAVGFMTALAEAGADFAPPATAAALDFEGLAVEFTRLFCGPGPHIPPYGSVHRTDDERAGQLWGTSTGEIKRFMAHYGIEPRTAGAIPDHIAILFEFMGRVIRAKLDAEFDAQGGTEYVAGEIQYEYFSRYVDPWVDAFLHRVRAAGPTPFYAALLAVTSEFMASERDTLMAGR